MKAKLLALVALASLLLAGAAFAKTNRLRGKVKGDGNSRVSLKVVLKRRHGVRRPTAVKPFKFSKVDYVCPDSGTSGEESGSFRSGKVRLFGPRGHRSYGFQLDKTTADGINIAVTGTVNKRGTKVKGSIEYTFSETGIGGDPDCSSGNVQFSARRRR
jgi:hypothetical protein